MTSEDMRVAGNDVMTMLSWSDTRIHKAIQALQTVISFLEGAGVGNLIISPLRHKLYELEGFVDSRKGSCFTGDRVKDEEKPDTVHLDFTYFKESGKYYCGGGGDFDRSLFDECIYPGEYGERLNELKMLPGLGSGTWSMPYVVETDYPQLVFPRPKGPTS